MRHFRRKEHIDAAVTRVWAVLADIERWPEWTASVNSVELLDRHPIGLGSRVRIHQPKLRAAIWVITSWEPGRRFVWESTSPGVTVLGGHVLEPAPSAGRDGCWLTLDLHFDGWLGGLLGLLKGRLAEHYVQLEAEGCKARSEAS